MLVLEVLVDLHRMSSFSFYVSRWAIALKDKNCKDITEGNEIKSNSIKMNIGACILALGVITPALMLAKRFTGKDDQEFQTKKEVREKLIKEGLIEA